MNETEEFRRHKHHAAAACVAVISSIIGGCALPHHMLDAALTPTQYHMLETRHIVDSQTINVVGVWSCQRTSHLSAATGSEAVWLQSRYQTIADAGKSGALVVALPSCGMTDERLSQYIPYFVRIVPVTDGLSCYEEYHPRTNANNPLSRTTYLSTTHKRISREDFERMRTEQDASEFNKRIESRFVRHPSPRVNEYVQYETLAALVLPETAWKGNSRLAGMLDPRWSSGGAQTEVNTIELNRSRGSEIARILEGIMDEHQLHTLPFMMKDDEWKLAATYDGMQMYCPIKNRDVIWKIRYAGRIYKMKYFTPFAVFDQRTGTVAVIDYRIFERSLKRISHNKPLEPTQ